MQNFLNFTNIKLVKFLFRKKKNQENYILAKLYLSKVNNNNPGSGKL